MTGLDIYGMILLGISTNIFIQKEVIFMKDCNCGYCMGGEILAGFGIKICDLKVSQFILFK